MDVSVIIVNYNTNELLSQCIHSVIEYTRDVAYEIIVVDNNSNEFTPDDYTSISNNIEIVRLSRNIGFGKANNEGVKIANGELVLFLNSDTLLLNDAISILYHHMKKHARVGICGGNLYTKEGEPNMSYTESFPTVVDYLKLLFGLVVLSRKEENFNVAGEVKRIGGYVSGADLMIRRSLLERYGGFDPDFFMYFEDVELCHRISKVGYEVHSVPSAKIIHLQGGSTTAKGEEISVKSRCFLLESEFIYFRKTAHKLASVALWISYLLKSFVALALYKCLRNKKKSIYWCSIIHVLRRVYDN